MPCQMLGRLPIINLMRAGRMFRQLGFALPIVGLAVVGFTSRWYVEDWQPPETPPAIQSRINGYLTPMRQAVLALGSTQGRARNVRRAADLWLGMNSTNQLPRLSPIALEDTSKEGVKAQILAARDSMINTLLLAARQEARSNPQLAAVDLRRALRLASISVGLDLYALFSSQVAVKRAMRAVADLAPILPLTARRKVLDEAQGRGAGEAIAVSLLRARALLAQRLETKARKSLPLEVNSAFEAYVSLIRKPGSRMSDFRKVQAGLSTSAGEAIEVLNLARLAVHGEEKRQIELNRLRAALS